MPLVLALTAGALAAPARADYNSISRPPVHEEERVRLDLDPHRTGRQYRELEFERQRQGATQPVPVQPGRALDSLDVVAPVRAAPATVPRAPAEHPLGWAIRNWKGLLTLASVLGACLWVLRRR